MKLTLLCTVIFVSVSMCLTAQTGVNWGRVTTIDFEDNTYGEVFAQSLDTVYVAKKGKIYKSTNSAATWSVYETGVEEYFYDIAFANLTTGYAVGGNGSLLKTTDAGVSWSQVTLTTSLDLYEIAITPSGTIWIVGENGTVIHSSDGIDWTEDVSVTSETLACVAFRSDTEGFISGTNGTLLHTTDGGVSWIPVSINTTEDIFNLEVSDTYIYVCKGSFGTYYEGQGFFVAKAADTFMKSTDLTFWNEEPVTAYSFSDMVFYNDEGYSAGGQFMFCECCELTFNMYTSSNLSWIISEEASLGWEGCGFNLEYFKMSMYQNQRGYAVSGRNLYQTPSVYNLPVKQFVIDDIVVSPNPVSDGYVSVNSESFSMNNLTFTLYNMQGNIIKTYKHTNGTLDVKGISSGVYFLSVKENDYLLGTKKLIID